MGMKYIIIKVKNREWPIIFPDMMVHSEVADSIEQHLRLHHNVDSIPIAAGSISFFGGEVRCSGESDTLQLESRYSEDEKLIRMFDYLHGIV